MIRRHAETEVREALSRQAAVALIGPRQVGKTTLAKAIARERGAFYLDLESRADRDKIADPALFLRPHEQQLVVLDEIHRAPELFAALRGLIDEGREASSRALLILGGGPHPSTRPSRRLQA